MKKLSLLVFITLAVACSKTEVVIPEQVAQSSAINYQDDYISIKDFKALSDSSDQSRITVSFTAADRRDVQKIEIMRGSTENTLCAVYVIKLNTQSVESKFYSYVDTKADDKKEMYYMLKYTLNNNNWGYTPVYKFKN